MRPPLLKSNCLNIIGFCLLLMFITTQTMHAQENVMTFKVGTFVVTVLSEGQGQGNTNILIGATEEMIGKAIPNGSFPIATKVFLVEANGKNLLIDAGYGQKTVDNLKLYGKKASDIDAVFITHFHGDHIGSLFLNNERSYPNAALYVSKAEYDYYMSDEQMNNAPENRRSGFSTARQLFKVYGDKLTIFTPDDIENAPELIPGLHGVAAYGHTPGHSGFLVKSEDKQLLFWGDLTHAMAIQMPYPEVAMTYDTDPVNAVEIRQKLLNYLSDSDIRIAGAHIPFPGIGMVRKNIFNGYIFTLTCLCEGKYPNPK
jgi:glyoxylase-like metal-dependent hydrolase (beta-lactamase superfamily II)